jgi:hypothetical protein
MATAVGNVAPPYICAGICSDDGVGMLGNACRARPCIAAAKTFHIESQIRRRKTVKNRAGSSTLG